MKPSTTLKCILYIYEIFLDPKHKMAIASIHALRLCSHKVAKNFWSNAMICGLEMGKSWRLWDCIDQNLSGRWTKDWANRWNCDAARTLFSTKYWAACFSSQIHKQTEMSLLFFRFNQSFFLEFFQPCNLMESSFIRGF